VHTNVPLGMIGCSRIASSSIASDLPLSLWEMAALCVLKSIRLNEKTNELQIGHYTLVVERHGRLIGSLLRVHCSVRYIPASPNLFS